ncbi:MAG: hypothetical protein ACREEV_14145 [Dongiaceae bacterium]|jgi:hypothetical protein
MRQFALLIGAVLVLAGCETATEEVDLELEFAERCAARGYASGTPEFNECVEDERQVRLVKRSAGTVY